MSAFHDNALIGASGQQGYKISRSVRLRSSASAYLNRTFGTPTSGTTWTWSGWVKLGTIPSTGTLFEAGTGATNTFMRCTFGQVSAELNWRQVTAVGGLAAEKGTSMLFRDPSAWYHIVCVWDTSNATAADRQRVYVNGLQVTAFGASTNPSLNLVSYFNTASYVHYLGALNVGGLGGYLDGYLTEINFIDGQALTPSSFGETDTTTGVWKPKKYAGTYGTNGFYLNFSDNSGATATTIGKDYSGNGNNWTPNNISVTAGATYDSMIDVPTLYADGGNGRGNYPVLNPLNADTSGLGTSLTYGNLRATGTTYAATAYSCTFQMPQSGKWYYEVVYSALTSQAYVGIRSYSTGSTDVQYGSSGQKSVAGSSTAYGASWTTGDVIGVAVDRDAGTVTFYKNNASQGAISIPTNSAAFDMAFNSAAPYGSASFDVNFGQRPFSYTPPTGFVALNTQNLPAPTISNGAQYMAATIWTGDGTSPKSFVNTVNGVSFKPDLVWTKSRNQVRNNVLFDSVRGAVSTGGLFSNLTDAEGGGAGNQTSVYGYVSAFNSNGFSATTGSTNINYYNANTDTFVAWQWQAGGTAVSNTSGSITSTVSVGATQGFSVVTYTGNSTSGATVGHGLGVAPSMVIVKARGTPNGIARSWFVYHASLGGTQFIYLDLTSAAQTGSTVWNNTNPSSTVFTLGNENSVNMSANNYVAYCFAEVAGYSKFGSYTGNGNSSDGPFVFTNFRPRWVMFKKTSATSNWSILDTSRDDFNVADNPLLPNTSGAESTSTSTSGAFADILSNGFKLRGNSGDINDSGATYIYAAFAESPFRNSLAR